DGHQMSKKDAPESARSTEEKEDTPESAKLTEEEEKSMQRREVMYAATVLPVLFMWILALVLDRGALLILILWGIYMIVVRSKVVEWNLNHPNHKIILDNARNMFSDGNSVDEGPTPEEIEQDKEINKRIDEAMNKVDKLQRR
ncbi:MAG: hypothetical protein J6Y90_00690, partial [Lachnospiraceae bacterium]|nr:hypothetical protein [Lachnospiraceae bacterium]